MAATVGAVLLCSNGQAQQCQALSVDAGGNRITSIAVPSEPSINEMAFSYPNVIRVRNANSLGAFGPDLPVSGSPSMVDQLWVDDGGARFMAIPTDNGIIYRASPDTQTQDWARSLRRVSCSSDKLGGGDTVAVALRRHASPTFQSVYASDVVLVATRYGCASGREDNRVFALNADTGMILFQFNGSGAFQVDAAVGLALDQATDTLYLATDRTLSTNQDSLWAINIMTGARRWSANAGQLAGKPLLRDGKVYVNTLHGEVAAFDAATGAALWSLDIDDANPVPVAHTMAAPSAGELNNDLVLVWDFRGTIRALRDNGTSAEWIWDTGFPPRGSQAFEPQPGVEAYRSPFAIAQSGRRVFSAGNQGAVYELDVATGELIETYEIDDEDVPLTAINRYYREREGRVLVGSQDGTLTQLCSSFPVVDTDGDGLLDSLEATVGTAVTQADTDGDGLSDYVEINIDGNANNYNPAAGDTDPTRADTDGDGYDDADELRAGTDPLDEGTLLCESVSSEAAPSAISAIAIAESFAGIAISYPNVTRLRRPDTLAAFGTDFVVAGAPSIADPLLVDDGGNRFASIPSEPGIYYRMNPDTQTQDWARDLKRPTCAADELGGGDTTAVALQRLGSTAFQSNYDDDVVFVATRFGCGTGSEDNRVYAMDATTGAILWIFNSLSTFDMDVSVGITLDQGSDTVFVATERSLSSSQHTLWAIDTVSGALRWSVNAGPLAGKPVLRGGRVYVNSLAGQVLAFDAAAGDELWTLAFDPDSVVPIATPMVAPAVDEQNGNLLLLWDLSGTVRALADNGDHASWVWDVTPPRRSGQVVDPSPGVASYQSALALTQSGARVFAAGNQGAVYELDVATGTLMDTREVDDPTVAITAINAYDPASVDANNPVGEAVLIGSADGTLTRICSLEGVSLPPTAADDWATTNEDTSVTIRLTDNDFDLNDNLDPASVNVDCTACQGLPGTLIWNGDGSVEYTPPADASGGSGLIYEVCNYQGQCDTASAFIFIYPVNDPPRTEDDQLPETAEDSGTLVIASVDLLSNDTPGPEGESAETLTITAVANATGGTVQLNGDEMEFSPAADFFGVASFEYTVQDDGRSGPFVPGTVIGSIADPMSATGAVSFTVTPVNDPPTALDDMLPNITQSAPAFDIDPATLLANDSPGPANETTQSLAVIDVSGTAGGAVELVQGSGLIRFMPAVGFIGEAEFEYTISDDGIPAGQAVARVRFQVERGAPADELVFADGFEGGAN